mmetsp:Transcript_161671/g.513804  ORF Transcript_161671/g.513804 Transcript_161671/m.513804 type:complete len:88 (-) Transcript_161671:5-268(-)
MCPSRPASLSRAATLHSLWGARLRLVVELPARDERRPVSGDWHRPSCGDPAVLGQRAVPPLRHSGAVGEERISLTSSGDNGSACTAW